MKKLLQLQAHSPRSGSGAGRLYGFRKASYPIGIISLCVGLSIACASALDGQPIAVSGHGGFFNDAGEQIPVTLGFASEVQAWYRDRLLMNLPEKRRRAFAQYEARLFDSVNAQGQDLLLLQHQSLEWLLVNTSENAKLAAAGKLRALRHAMNWVLPDQATLQIVKQRKQFQPHPEVARQLESMLVKSPDDVQLLSITVNKGQAYIDECQAAGVPIPPSINVLDPTGLAGWRSEGFIPPGEQFIIGTPAELRSYRSTFPEGMCYALPRYTDADLDEVQFDGVICMGKQTSNVCFWDNQWTNPMTDTVEAFNFTPGQIIPIGVPDFPGGKYQAGGAEIEFGPGDVCTDCHAGENPYIVHPKSVIRMVDETNVLWESLHAPAGDLPSFTVNRYNPIVAATWPQNQFSQASVTLPVECASCHFKTYAGRFPHLSNKLPGYCGIILANAITDTMPPGSPGSAIAVANAFRSDWCDSPPNADSQDVGDPHIKTVDGTHYDFQAAGEFTILRNGDTGFELQTRQSPVLTTFSPGANPYTGLSSCVSLNTAVALRTGKSRITYQPEKGAFAGREGLVLRVDGYAVKSADGIDLGDGNFVSQPQSGGDVDIAMADGSRVVIMPRYWSSQGYWYLDVQVFNTTAREGVMGPILGPGWLPRAPDGSSFGTKPMALIDRHYVLNQKFADAWRVTGSSSLFDYETGIGTADFTDLNWPSEPGKSCDSTSIAWAVPVIKQPQPALAKRACRGIKDPAILANCLLDVAVMGDAVAAQSHHFTDESDGL